jgi:hypothetical protein
MTMHDITSFTSHWDQYQLSKEGGGMMLNALLKERWMREMPQPQWWQQSKWGFFTMRPLLLILCYPPTISVSNPPRISVSKLVPCQSHVKQWL